MKNKFDKIIIGAGLYGLYAAEYSSRKEEQVLVLEYDREPFSVPPILIRPECIWGIIIQEV